VPQEAIAVSMQGACAAGVCATDDDADFAAQGDALLQQRATRTDVGLVAQLSEDSGAAAASPDDTLKPIATFDFAPEQAAQLAFRAEGEEKNLEGANVDGCGPDPNVAVARFGVGDVVGSFALARTNRGSRCSDNPKKLEKDYLVQRGFAEGGGLQLEAYKVTGPQTPSRKRLQMTNMIFLKAQQGRSATLYILEDGAARPLLNVSGSGGFAATGLEVRSGVYVLAPAETAMPPTTSLTAEAASANECLPQMPPGSHVGEVMLMLRRDRNGRCHTNGNQNGDRVLYEVGTVRNSHGREYRGFRVSPPQQPPRKRTSSVFGIYYRAPAGMDLVVSWYDGTHIVSRAPVSAAANAWTYVGMSADELKGPTIFVFHPPEQHVGHLEGLSSTAEGARLQAGGAFSLSLRRFSVGGRPNIPELDRNIGPSKHNYLYGYKKHFFPVARADGLEGIVWQDQETKAVSVTWLAADLRSSSTRKLLDTDKWLLGATSNGDDALVLFLCVRSPDWRQGVPAAAELAKYDSRTGGLVLRVDVPTTGNGTKAEPALSVLKPYGPGGSMAWDAANDVIGLQLTRTGLGNHVQGRASLIDASTLKLLKNKGTASHSYGSSMVARQSGGGFWGLDVSDAFPQRGIVIYSYTMDEPSKKDARRRLVAVKWKDQHARGTRVWAEIAHPGIVEVDSGLLVFFSAEDDPLDTTELTGKPMNVQRNVGLVKIPKDLSSEEVLSDGPTVSHTYRRKANNKTFVETNRGLKFLTANPDLDHSSSRVKTALLGPGRILVWFERWARDGYADTQYLVVDESGAVVSPPATVHWPVRLGATDDVIARGGRMVMYTGGENGQLLRYEVCVLDCVSM